MSNIRIKINSRNLTLRNMIELYRSCQQLRQQLYIYSKKSMGLIKNLIDFETYRLTYPENEYIIVIEGREANDIVKRFEGLIGNIAIKKADA